MNAESDRIAHRPSPAGRDRRAGEGGGRRHRTARWPRACRPAALVDEALIPAMDEAGRLFECGEFFVPELLVAARALKASQALITPLLAGSPTRRGRARSPSAR